MAVVVPQQVVSDDQNQQLLVHAQSLLASPAPSPDATPSFQDSQSAPAAPPVDPGTNASDDASTLWLHAQSLLSPSDPSQAPASPAAPVTADQSAGAQPPAVSPSTPTIAPSSDLPTAPAPPAAGPSGPSSDDPLYAYAQSLLSQGPSAGSSAPAPAPSQPYTPPATAPPQTDAGAFGDTSNQGFARSGASFTPTTVGLSGGTGSALVDPGAQATLGLINTTAQAWGLNTDGARAAQAVGLTEGALVPRADGRDVGDNGHSFGPFQFYDQGQLRNFAADLGLSLSDAGQYARSHPDVAITWALSPRGANGWQANGYLGDAIRAGQQQGLSGAQLAQYAQQHGQVSVQPERAGANYQALFGSGDQPAPLAPASGVPAPTSGNQFSDPTLTSDEAYAACGPAAAVAFARANGRNPTLKEALDLAQQQQLWSSQTGMYGIGAEKALMDSMQIPNTLETTVSADRVATAIKAGQVAAISTPGHYFVADGYDPQTGAFHVGASGTALKNGSEWMTLDQMQQTMGPANGVLYTQRVAVPDQSPAANAPTAGQQQDNLGVEQGQPVPIAGPPQQPAAAAPLSITPGSLAPYNPRALPTTPAQNPVQAAVTGAGQAVANSPLGQTVQQDAAAAPSLLPVASSALQAAPGLVSQGLDAVNLGNKAANETAAQEASLQRWADANPDQAAELNDLLMRLNRAGTLTPAEMQRLNDLSTQRDAYIAALPDRPTPWGNNDAAAAYAQQYDPQALQADRDLAGNTEAAAALALAPDADVGLLRNVAAGVVDPGQALGNAAFKGAGEALGLVGQGVKAVGGAVRDALTPAADTALPAGTTELNAGVTPGNVGKAIQSAGAWLDQHLLAPVKNIPDPTIRQAITQYANVIGQDSRASAVEAANWAQRIQQVLGPADTTQAADLMRSFEQTGTFGPTATPAQQQLASDLKQMFDTTRDQGIADGYIRGDVTKMGGGPGNTVRSFTQTPPGTQVFYKGQPWTVLAANGDNDITIGDGLAKRSVTVMDLNQTAVAPNNYFPHTWAEDPATGTPAATNQARGALSPNSFYSQGRTYLTVDDALQAGKQPVSISDAVSRYVLNISDSEAKVQLIQNLKAASPNLVVPLGPKAQVPSGMVPGSAIDSRLSSPLRNYAFDPSIVPVLQNITQGSAIRNHVVGQAILQGIGSAKQSLFSLSGFHAYTEGLTAYLSDPKAGQASRQALFSPSFYTGQRYGPMADTFVQAARAGVTGLTGRMADAPDTLGGLGGAVARGVIPGVASAGVAYQDTLSNKGSQQDALRNAGLAGVAGFGLGATLGGKITTGIFDRAVPMAKVTAWDALTKGGMPADQAADAVNRTFGGLNYAALGRSQTFQDALRLTVQAPDWNESTIRQLGTAFFGKDVGAGFSRGLLARTVLATAALTETLQMALTGHSTLQNDPGHQAELQLDAPDGKHVYTGLGPGNLQAYLNLADTRNVGSFVTGRGAGVLTTAYTALSNQQYPGGPAITTKGEAPLPSVAGQAAHAVGGMAPTSISGAVTGAQHGLNAGLAGLAGLLGLNLRYQSGSATPASSSSGRGVSRGGGR